MVDIMLQTHFDYYMGDEEQQSQNDMVDMVWESPPDILGLFEDYYRESDYPEFEVVKKTDRSIKRMRCLDDMGRNRRLKGPNIHKSIVQLLEDCYGHSNYPEIEVVDDLHNKTGIPIKKIRQWFSNKRKRDTNTVHAAMDSTRQVQRFKHCDVQVPYKQNAPT